ncbi:hypothetical protein HanHA89_Chr09g0359761 [Helianthus annuus]|nr:hypothetical protein HanHA89_Chr09g0359761 [Helianthus annuus]
MTSRSAESRPTLRVFHRVWSMYSTDSFEFALTNSGKFPHNECSIVTRYDSLSLPPSTVYGCPRNGVIGWFLHSFGCKSE